MVLANALSERSPANVPFVHYFEHWMSLCIEIPPPSSDNLTRDTAAVTCSECLDILARRVGLVFTRHTCTTCEHYEQDGTCEIWALGSGPMVEGAVCDMWSVGERWG